MTTKRRPPRYLSTVLLGGGALLVVVAVAAAIVEGYAADAQARGGNIVPELVIAGLGIASAIVGLILPPVSPRSADPSDEASERNSSS